MLRCNSYVLSHLEAYYICLVISESSFQIVLSLNTRKNFTSSLFTIPKEPPLDSRRIFETPKAYFFVTLLHIREVGMYMDVFVLFFSCI